MRLEQKQVLPIEFDRNEFSLEDLELFCTCGHYVNEHDGGLGGGDSLCEIDDCGCLSCEFDYEYTVSVHYFTGNADHVYITKLSADTKRMWGSTHYGIPYLKEPKPLTIQLRSPTQ